MIRAYLALGSNLGDRQRFLDDAVARLRAAAGLTIRRVSPYYETAPVGGPAGAGAYLNAVADADTSLSPEQLLATLLDVERQFGRVRSEQNAPRTLDLDLLLYGDLIRPGPDPIVPHPRMTERRFVLQPLTDLAPDLVPPGMKRTVAELLAALPADADPPKVFRRDEIGTGRELTGLRALVTGSTSGIGRAIAVELARGGADVLVHGRRPPSTADSAITACRSLGVRADLLLSDLSDAAACDRLIAESWDAWGGLDVVVLNAGADVVTGEAGRWSFERKWEALVAVDVTATVRISRAIGERMKVGAGGTILTMGWDQAETGIDVESGQLFGPAKAAVMAFTRNFAKAMAPRVRVNCLAPGWIKTAWGETAPDEWQQRVMAETPLKRWGLPEDVARTARWLVSPAASFITGQVIRINGGAI
jgi:3-oxoacyl-[acyl-carrier protein] reductase